jgi:hypothetical protein
MLIKDGPVPIQTEEIESPEDAVCAAGNLSQSIEILHAQEPMPAATARVQPASQSRDEGAEMQRTGGGWGKTPAVGRFLLWRV